MAISFKKNGVFEIFIDGTKITSRQGSTQQFSRVPTGNSLDAVLFTSNGVGSVQTRVLIDDVRLGTPGGWRMDNAALPLPIAGDTIETDALTSGAWHAVPNNTGSTLQITHGNAHDGLKSGESVGGIAGFNSSEMEQIIDISSLGYDFKIDDGQAKVSISAYGQSFQIGDYAKLRLEFLDSSNGILNSVEPVYVNDATGVWKQMQINNALLPAGTRRLRLVVGVVRSSGVTTDAYIDGRIEGKIHSTYLESIIPVQISGASVESDAMTSGAWQAVPNSTGSSLQITRGAAHTGLTSGKSVGGINGFNTSEMEQIIDLSSLGYNAEIDNGQVITSFSAFGQSFQIGDYAQLQLEFLDSAGVALTATTPAIINDAAGVWKQMRINNTSLPIGTRKLRLVFGVVRSAGVTTDAYLDGKIEGALYRNIP